MKLKTQEFVEKWLSKARYTFDESVSSWSGWIEGLPGIYAQGDDVESVRGELAEILEEYLLTEIKEGHEVPGFPLKAGHRASSR